jgi:hypothetical protein
VQDRRRAELLETFGALTGAQVGALSPPKAENSEEIADRWKAEGRLFSVLNEGAELYPAFQFDAQGAPRPVIRRVLEVVGRPSGWEIALWFTAANGWLDEERPVDLLAEADCADGIVDAARRAFEPLAV